MSPAARRRSAAIVAGLALAGSAALATEPLGPLVDRLAVETLAEWKAPGMAIAVVENGELAHLAGYGVADVDTRAPIDPETTLFHVASISKPVTAAAVLELAERGVIDLDRGVEAYLPGLAIDNPHDRPLTARHLLTHAGGLDARRIGRVARTPEGLGDLGEHLARRLPPVVRPPGEISTYSNYGFALLGLLVEKASGRPFADQVERELFAPLGMSRSSFALRPELEAALATGYGWRGTEGPPEPLDYQRTVPASGLRTTAADMSRFLLALVGGGELEGRRVLTTESVAAMLSRQYANHPLLGGRSLGLSEGRRFQPPTYLHSGGTGGFSSALLVEPTTGFGVFVVFNSRAFAWDLIGRLLDRLEGRLAPLERAVPDPDLAIDTGRFEGWYRSAEMPLSTIGRLATLVEQTRVRAAGPGAIEWNGARYAAAAPLAFVNDAGGVVAFGEPGGEIRYFFRPGGGYERIGWLDSRPVQLALWILATVVFLALAGTAAATRLRRRRAPRPPRPGLGAAGLAAAIHLIFLAGLGVVMARELGGDGSLAYGAPWWLYLLLTLPLLALAPTALAVVATARSLGAGESSVADRLGRGGAILVLALFPLLLAYWNLLGYRF